MPWEGGGSHQAMRPAPSRMACAEHRGAAGREARIALEKAGVHVAGGDSSSLAAGAVGATPKGAKEWQEILRGATHEVPAMMPVSAALDSVLRLCRYRSLYAWGCKTRKLRVGSREAPRENPKWRLGSHLARCLPGIANADELATTLRAERSGRRGTTL